MSAPTQMGVRLTPEHAEAIDELVAEMSTPQVKATRADALRWIISLGLPVAQRNAAAFQKHEPKADGRPER